MSKITITLEIKNINEEELIAHLNDNIMDLMYEGFREGKLYHSKNLSGKWSMEVIEDKNSYKFTSNQIVEASTEEEAKMIFADNSLDFAANASCYKIDD